MSIVLKDHIVHISNNKISYVMEVVDGKYLIHRYFGKTIRKYRGQESLCILKEDIIPATAAVWRMYLLTISHLNIL